MSALALIEKASLPTSYQAAQTALEKCARIDECKDWKDKSAALASYAKQSGDESLYRTSMRIKDRATRRMGELLGEMEQLKGRPQKGLPEKPERGVGLLQTRAQIQKETGISEKQQQQAIAIASIPKREFEKLVEAEEPPTVTELVSIARERKQPTPPSNGHLKGRDPEEFNEAIHVRGAMRRFADKCREVSASKVFRGSDEDQRAELRQLSKVISAWLVQLDERLEK